MDIDYDLYKTFYVVANCSSLTEASKKLMISQPAVTKAIQNLESQLNGTLFIRNKSGRNILIDSIALFTLLYVAARLKSVEFFSSAIISSSIVGSSSTNIV